MVRKIALAILLTSAAGIASATPTGMTCTTHYFLGIIPYEVCTWNNPPPKPVVAAPEIDAASAVAALTLLVGGLAVLRGRRSKIANA
jgi:hypothetical protein